ncbi:MAG: YbjN domain-containing protein [Myxococcota bacterium]
MAKPPRKPPPKTEAKEESGKKHLKVEPSTIEALLREGGWRFDRITEDTWRCRFRGRKATFPFLLRIDPQGYLTVAIVPYLKTPEDEEQAAALYDRLLQLNQVLLMAKFSIDDDLDIVLSVEYPTRELDRSEFTDVLDVLSYYADSHFDELVAAGGLAS